MNNTDMHIAKLNGEKKELLRKETEVGKLTKSRKAKIDAFFEDEEKIEKSFDGAEYLHRGPIMGRPRVEDKKVLVTMRLTESTLNNYKARTGRGWQTKLREYVEKGITTGLL